MRDFERVSFRRVQRLLFAAACSANLDGLVQRKDEGDDDGQNAHSHASLLNRKDERHQLDGEGNPKHCRLQDERKQAQHLKVLQRRRRHHAIADGLGEPPYFINIVLGVNALQGRAALRLCSQRPAAGKPFVG
ncbi:MAG: hypothetical protein EOP82_02340 [Variovorax sp.]|nr:MAG: hypothetical protein EOP82_02340 [Variovorax sp.]